MTIEKIETGYLQENCYILKDEINKECLVIDPGADFLKIKEKINDHKILKILITHNHFDHIGALEEMLNEYKVDYIDKSKLEEKEYQINNFSFKVIFTKGHTTDSVTYYFEKDNIMFTGDFLFKDTIGRYDLPTGSYSDMKKSINKIKEYNGSIKIYPGHGDMSTLVYEFQNNFYFK